jgi:hypothetical protein
VCVRACLRVCMRMYACVGHLRKGLRQAPPPPPTHTQVGLTARKDSLVGGSLVGGLSVRGLSGGEKRRLSICCGAVARPSLLFLDEPTSGVCMFACVCVCVCVCV